MILTLTLGALATFFGGAYIGTVVENATDSPQVAIQSATVKENKPLDSSDFWKAGLIGVGAYLIYLKFFKK